MIEIAVHTADGRAPIVAATGTNCTRESISLSEAAQKAGASAILVATPYYNKPNQAGRCRHYSEIARAVDLPLILEADPSRAAIDMSSETLAQLAGIPKIVGIEDVAAGGSRWRDGAFSSRGNFAHLSGDDEDCVQFRLAGGAASISIVANVVPKLWAAIQRAINARDWERAASAQAKLRPLLGALALEPNPGPIKHALSLLHPWFSSQMRLPLPPVSRATGAAICEALGPFREHSIFD